MLPCTAAAEPVFDAALTFLAINTLECELEEAGCFEDGEYSEIQENFTIKRRTLRHEGLHQEWLKVLRSGEVLLTLFHRSPKVRSILDMHKCPLQPVLQGSEHSNWQRLRTQFLCNWQSLYSVIEYLQQFVNVKVDGLDSSGMIIVDCTDIETARIIIMGALTQCFILLGKQPLASISGDCQRPSQQHQQHHQQPHQPHEDVNNNAEQRTLEGGGSRNRSGDHRKKTATSAAVAAAAGTAQKHQQPHQRSSGSARSRSIGGRRRSTSGAAAAAAATAADSGGGGANSNNDGGGVKRITKSTVQDLICKLQAVLNEDA